MAWELRGDGVLCLDTPGAKVPIACRSLLTLHGDALLRVHVEATPAERAAHLARTTALAGQPRAFLLLFDRLVGGSGWLGALGLILHAALHGERLRALALALAAALLRQFVLPPLKRAVGRWLVGYTLRRLDA